MFITTYFEREALFFLRFGNQYLKNLNFLKNIITLLYLFRYIGSKFKIFDAYKKFFKI